MRQRGRRHRLRARVRWRSLTGLCVRYPERASRVLSSRGSAASPVIPSERSESKDRQLLASRDLHLGGTSTLAEGDSRRPKHGAPRPRRVSSSSAVVPFAVSALVVPPLRRLDVLCIDRASRLPALAFRAVLRLSLRELSRDLCIASRVAFLADVPTRHPVPPEAVSYSYSRIPASRITSSPQNTGTSRMP